MILSPPAAGPAAPDTTVTDAVFGARSWGERAAVVEAGSGRALSYAGLAEAIGAAAGGLVRAGLGEGTAVGLLVPDTPEFVVAAHAVMAAGAGLVPVRATAGRSEIVRRLRASRARALITWPVLADVALESVGGTDVERVFCFGDEPDVEPFSTLLHGGPGPRTAGEPGTGVAVLAEAGPAAGAARDVWLTHRHLVAGLVQLTAAGMLSGSDVVLSGVPFADVVGLNGVLAPALRLGATVVARCGSGTHDLLRTLADHRVTVAVLPPGPVETLAFDEAVDRYDLSALRSVVSTGGPLSVDVARACAARLGCPVRQAYGQAAAAGFTHLNLRAAEEGTLDSIGRGLPWVSWQVVDPTTGLRQPSYRPGELRLRGPMVAAPHGGWLPTGDAAFADEHGRVYIVGRMDATRPEPPADPGVLLARHPAVEEAVVVPVPDEGLGLAPHAFVVLRGPGRAEDLLRYVNGHLPTFQRILAIHEVDAIPRSPGGRVLRRALLERVRLSP
ncbi:AMP-binding protein [Thermomonospora umbrina]|uniref:Acyl-CoA synthetase (AMP-forming)/AMP-acid ligase II n=1 Tax=Thermomonospora umbrina TaxID=111806 RepID=A0A3D9SHC3_9ACTN|nr:AMP-binding protein [Thermomonospora umbrina]REE95097.1 acyl-CoA synthetase (AMP-forming)/AMP-acid ligase II [Thermomonospora umbrina]